MIKNVTVTNYLGESIEMELRNPEKSGFLIRRIEGLGPSKANINMTEMSTSDGSVYNSAKADSRNIVLTLGFMFKETIEDVRHLSYKYFPIKKPVIVRIETDNRIAEAYGFVESNEPDIFSKEEQTQISIICPDPYFYSEEITITVLSGFLSLFEFPFSNESLDEDLLIMGETASNTTGVVSYNGDAEIGIVIIMHATGNVKNITIHNTETRESMKINTTRDVFGGGFGPGDDIIISTVKGNKYIRLLRAGVYTNILNSLEKDTDWFQLRKGDNYFAYEAEEGIDFLEFKIENQTLYEGV